MIKQQLIEELNKLPDDTVIQAESFNVIKVIYDKSLNSVDLQLIDDDEAEEIDILQGENNES